VASPRKLGGPGHQVRLLAQATADLTLGVPLPGPSTLLLSLGPTLALSRPELWYARADETRAHVYRPMQLGAIFRLTVIIGGT
jgi:hypothetical protein